MDKNRTQDHGPGKETAGLLLVAPSVTTVTQDEPAPLWSALLGLLSVPDVMPHAALQRVPLDAAPRPAIDRPALGCSARKLVLNRYNFGWLGLVGGSATQLPDQDVAPT
jgi:hypothetical protein